VHFIHLLVTPTWPPPSRGRNERNAHEIVLNLMRMLVGVILPIRIKFRAITHPHPALPLDGGGVGGGEIGTLAFVHPPLTPPVEGGELKKDA